MLYDMRRFCQTLTISDFPSDWRQFEQSLFRELQERFKLTINHSELVQFKGKDELFVGDFQGTRKAALRLLRWWMSPPTQYATRNYMKEVWDGRISEVRASRRKKRG
ncbi:unnamed protein product, partial [Aphanomyces euteiches]